MRKFVGVSALLSALALAVACSKAPAEAALKAADQALETAKPEVEKLVPDQWKPLSDAASAAHQKFEQGDYAGALSGAQEIPTKVQEALKAAKAKKNELMKAWDDMKGNIPAMIGAITTKVNELAAMKKLPKGFDPAVLESAKSGLASVNQMWTGAADASKNGDWTGAVQRGGEIKAKAQELMKGLGLAAASAPAQASPTK